MINYHLAQINIARMLAPIDDPIMTDFVAQLPPINALAEQSAGFVWRLQADGGDATSIKVYDDNMIIINLTVWESVDTLREFVYKSNHFGVLREHAESPFAFSFKNIFPRPAQRKLIRM